MKKIFTLFTLLLCVVSSAWAQTTLFLWQYDGSTTYGDGTNGEFAITATTGTAKFVTYEKKQTSAEGTIGYATTVTDTDLKPNITKGCKLGNNGAHIKCSPASGNFKAGDIVYVCAYNPVIISTGKASPASTSDIRENGVLTSSLATGSEKGSYAVGTFTIPSNFAEGDVIYISRVSSSVGVAAIKVVRPVSDTRTAVTLSFPEASYNVNLGESFPAPTLTVDPPAAASEVAYASSKENVATVASDGTITLVGAGTTTITASISDSETYQDASASYTLEVTDPNIIVLGYTEPIDETQKKLGARTFSEVDHLTFTLTYAVGGITDYKGSSKTVRLNNEDYTNTDSWRKNKNGYVQSDGVEQWVGYNIAVESGYALSLNHVDARILINDDTYSYYLQVLDANDNELYKSSEITNVKKADNPTKSISADISLANLTGTIKVKLWLTQNGGSKYFSIDKLIFNGKVVTDDRPTYTVTTTITPEGAGTVTPSSTDTFVEGSDVVLTATPNEGYKFVKWTIEGADNTNNPYTIEDINENKTAIATFEALPKITFEKGEGSGKAPSVDYAEAGSNYIIPQSYFLYKEGYTLTAWNDGTTNHAVGGSMEITGDVTLTPVFTENSVGLGDAEATVNWNFDKSSGAPVIAFQYAEDDVYVQHAIVNETYLDVLMHVNTKADAVIEGKTGKVNNESQANCAQVNNGTKFTIPATNGMVITYTCTQGTPTIESVTFNGEAPTVNGKVLTYTYTGNATSIDIISVTGDHYPSGISVVYPLKKTKYTTPVITVGNFNFEDKGYEVTISAIDGKLQVSTDGTTYTEQTSPYVTYATTTTTYYAKATGNDYGDSNVSQQEVTNDFDATKKYVAWIYEPTYKNKNEDYDITTDKLVNGLKETYNVVLVGYASTATPAEDLKNADLVAISEATTGKGAMLIALKNFVGEVPMLNMKFYAYSSGRWEWGIPNNPGSDKTAMSVASKGYKVLNGVTFEADGTVSLFEDTASQNHIQTVKSWSAAPEGNVEMATVSVTSGETTTQEVAMHASNSKKFFGIGLSCDDYNNYSDNAVTIIKNAAAILIAGDDITAINEAEDPVVEGDVVTLTTTATMAGWRAFYDGDNSYTVDENTKVYVASEENEGKVTLTEYADGVPAGTPVILKTSAAAENDGSFKMTLTKTTETITPTYTGESLLKVTPCQGNVYRLGSKNGEVGFFPFNATGAAAGIVVLNIDSSNAGARGLGITFDDDVTGISQIENEKLTIENFFDLQGRSVAKPTKGLYIVNGKKVVIK